MAKKDLGGVTELLAPLAASMPTQRPPAPALKVVPDSKPARAATATKPAAAPAGEPVVNQLFQLRESLRVQLEHMARDKGMTTRAFILHALQAQGLAVEDSDLLDRRKHRR